MPKRAELKKVLVLGSGPIVIGQGAEFDYSGAQACQSLREEGIEVVLVNSNPATIMTDKETADIIYVEPLTLEVLERIIAKERPQGIIPGMGGQTGLNLSLELYDAGVLEKYQVEVLGTSIESIRKGEDRELFRNLMERIKEPVVESCIISDLSEVREAAEILGYPVVVRPAYTLGGTGGGIAENEEELISIAEKGLLMSRVHQVLLEKSVKGWKEIEFEVMRDRNGTAIAVCSMENVDPVGIHTGDSIVVAPAQTLTDKELQMLRSSALHIVEAVGIEGGCNVQFALHPHSFQYAVIEINPRVSRSSALASKATGYPIAKVAAKVALGYVLEEIPNAVTDKTTAAFEPSLDYVVVKMPKWPFDKFYTADRKLGTKMMATGEVMAVGNSFESAFLKGLRSLEIRKYALKHEGARKMDLLALKEKVLYPNDERIFYLAELLRRGMNILKLSEDTGMDRFFLEKIRGIVKLEESLESMGKEDLTEERLRLLKQKGFSDKGIGDLLSTSPDEIYEMRMMWGILPVYKMVDTCAGEFDASTPYYYSTYDQVSESAPSSRKKIMVIGSGPIRIGQGIEFDYSSVHCIKALKKLSYETILVNSNPETVSTDFNIADKLYFEPLTEEEVYNIISMEKPEGVILQFGGQTAVKLARFLQEKKVTVLGTSPEAIDAAEDREKFEEILEKLSIKRPIGKGVWSVDEGRLFAESAGYPVLVRPSYVLGGQGMEICHGEEELLYYLENAFLKDKKTPVLIDQYIDGMELEVDAICDGEEILVPGIMEHLEHAGVHSGDSVSIYPPIHVSENMKKHVMEVTRLLGAALQIIGMMNLQFIVKDEELYIIEVNPRASRTVPFMTKVTDLPVVAIATEVMLGRKLKDLPYGSGLSPEIKRMAVKVPVFSTEKLPQVEASLGPEMRSTGEVLGVGDTLEEALYKGFLAAGIQMERKRRFIAVTLGDADKKQFEPLAKKMDALGYKFYATEGTRKLLKAWGIGSDLVYRIGEGKPTILDLVEEQNVDVILNTPTKGNDVKRDGFRIRRAAVESKVELMTSLDKMNAFLSVLEKQYTAEQLSLYSLS